jgi:hypothetical protein
MVHAGVDAIEHLGKEATLRSGSHTSLLCPVISRHPLEKPRVGFVMAGYFKVDKHSSSDERSAMLKSFLTSARCDTKRCETKALQQL